MLHGVKQPWRWTVIAIVLAAFTLVADPASAGSLPVPPLPDRNGVQAVQYYGPGPQDRGDEWDQRRQWRESRQDRDEARIAEAVRRETQMIEQEHEQRRAWREQQGGGMGAATAISGAGRTAGGWPQA